MRSAILTIAFAICYWAAASAAPKCPPCQAGRQKTDKATYRNATAACCRGADVVLIVDCQGIRYALAPGDTVNTQCSPSITITSQSGLPLFAEGLFELDSHGKITRKVINLYGRK